MRQSAALSSATQHAMPLELGGKWGKVCLNTKFPIPTLLCVGYSVKHILFYTLLKNFYQEDRDKILILCFIAIYLIFLIDTYEFKLM